jgi:hypothetical protein
MQWPPTVSFPFNAGFVALNRLPIRHYPHRDPIQMERRYKLRSAMMAAQKQRLTWSDHEVPHWVGADWQRFVVSNDQSELTHWDFGTTLPEYHFVNHLTAPYIRLIQRTLHSCLLPVLDFVRPHWPSNTLPQPIPDEMVRQLENDLRC